MELIVTNERQFVVRWLAQISERSIRLHQYLSRLAISAPRSYARCPPIIAVMIREVEEFAQAVRGGAQTVLADKGRDDESDLHIMYANCTAYVRQFLKLHAKLSHLPKDWVRSEVELFLNSIGGHLNENVLECLGEKPRILDNFSVVASPIYNFANLLDDEAHQGRIRREREVSGAARDLLAIPAIEQNSTLFWPMLIHELAHSIFDRFDLKRSKEILEYIEKNVERDAYDKVADCWIEEIFCDLFAAAICGPIYLIALTVFSIFWSADPIKIPSLTHPSPDSRLKFIAIFLRRTNPKLMNSIAPELSNLATLRAKLDFRCKSEDVQAIQKTIKKDGVPTEENALKIAELLGRSQSFLELTRPPHQANLAHIIQLQDRISTGEFIGTSRDAQFSDSVTLEEVSDNFELYASRLVEKPNSILDVLTAAACYQTRLLVDKSQFDAVLGAERIKQFPKLYVDDVLSDDVRNGDFIKVATDLIHGVDAVTIKSLEASELGAFYLEGE